MQAIRKTPAIHGVHRIRQADFQQTATAKEAPGSAPELTAASAARRAGSGGRNVISG
jgi:hypothetical protein